MQRVHRATRFFTVPDGTQVAPFLNAADSLQSELPWGCLGEMSVAAGRIEARTASAIHVHPLVTQVTYVTRGRLTVRMREAGPGETYSLAVPNGSAVVTRPGTLLQLANETDAVVEVLYLVSPAYVFEERDGRVIYDDSLVVAAAWDEVDLPAVQQKLQIDLDARKRERAASLARLAAMKGAAPASSPAPVQP